MTDQETGASSSESQEPPPVPPSAESFLHWYETHGGIVFDGFWRTVLFVLLRRGRLAEWGPFPISRAGAKRFRFGVVALAVLGLSAIYMLGVALQHEDVDTTMLRGLIFLPVWALFTWVCLRCAIGVTRWFLCPPHLSDEQHQTWLALSDYATAPLALLVFLFPLAAIVFTESHSRIRVALLAGDAVVLAIVLYWFWVIVGALRGIAGVTRRRVVLSAVAIPLVWLLIAAGIALIPVTAVMWAMLYGSLF